MNNYKIFSAIILTVGMGATCAFAADNGITKEDIKRLQVNALAEEMQLEMEKSVHSDLQSNMKATEFDIQGEVSVTAADDQSLPAPPAVSSR